MSNKSSSTSSHSASKKKRKMTRREVALKGSKIKNSTNEEKLERFIEGYEEKEKEEGTDVESESSIEIDDEAARKILDEIEDKTSASNKMIQENLPEEKDEDEELAAKTASIIKTIRKQNNAWGLSTKAVMAEKLAMAGLATKNGMYARVPLSCKGQGCPYSEQCTLLPYDMAPVGEYCPIELAQIELRASSYARDIDYDSSSFTDKNLLSELVLLDVVLERCKALLAKEGTPVVDMAIGVDQEGNEIRQPSVSKAWEAYEKVSKKRDQTYQLLMMTRKDKKNEEKSAEAESVSDMLHNVIDATNIDEEDIE